MSRRSDMQQVPRLFINGTEVPGVRSIVTHTEDQWDPTGPWRINVETNTPQEPSPVKTYTTHRFSVGDHVRIAKPFGTAANHAIGRIAIVTERNENGAMRIRLVGDDVALPRGYPASYFWWYDEELEPAEEPAANVGTAQPFWLVWREPGTVNGHETTPYRKHGTELEARTEAKRLAAKHPGARFVIVRAVAAEEVEVVKTQRTTQFATGAG